MSNKKDFTIKYLTEQLEKMTNKKVFLKEIDSSNEVSAVDIAAINKNSKLSDDVKKQVIEITKTVKNMTDEEKLNLEPLSNPIKYIALSLTDELRSSLLNLIQSQGEDVNLTETQIGLSGTFRFNNILYKLTGMDLITNLSNSLHSTGRKSKTNRVTKSGRSVSQTEYSDRIRDTKKSQELSLIKDKEQIRKIFNL